MQAIIGSSSTKATKLSFALAASLLSIPLSAFLAPELTAQTTAQEAAQGADLPATASAPVVPQQVRYAGKLATRAGQSVEALFRIYADSLGGEPLWTETQKVSVAEDESYTVLLGSATPAGLPQAVFAGGAARWLGVSVDGAPEQERVLLSSVPYAMKSADAESLAGHAAADFVTQAELAQAVQSAAAPPAPVPAVTPFALGTVTGSGTAGAIPLWTATNTQASSVITQTAGAIGINKATPATTLDVGGAATIEGTLVMPAVSPATSTIAYRSQVLSLGASAWSSTAKAAVAQNFRLSLYPIGSNTPNPSGILYFQFQEGTNPAANVLSIAGNGVIGFAPTQTFPGTIKSVTATAPVTATTTAGAVTVGLDQPTLITDITPALETSLNSVYARLAGGNIFTSYLEAYQTSGPGNAALLGWGSSGSVGTFGDSDTGYGIQGESTSGKAVFGEVTAPVAGSQGVLGSTGTVFSSTYTSEAGVANAGVWADNSGVGTGLPVALFATGDNAYAAAAVNNSASYPGLFVDNNGGTAGQFQAATGYGVSASTSSGTGAYGATGGGGDGVEGINNATASQDAGVLGVANTTSGTYGAFNVYAGVWGDTGTSSTTVAPAWAIGVLGTADDSHAGVFLNNSASWATMYVSNASTGGIGNAAPLFNTLMVSSTGGTCGVGTGGNFSCTGQIKSLVSAGNGARTVETYAVQSPENWMEDFGSGQLKGGVAVINIDPAFAETVTGDSSYHVFITPNGDSKGLYVIAKTATTFEVRESGGGTSSLTFDYRIVAKRRGYEAQRLVDVTEHYSSELKSASMVRGTGVVHKLAPLANSSLHAALNAPHRVAAPNRLPTRHAPISRPEAQAHP